ncbi:hypothetical protein GCM10010282_45720 [Streptomyces roseolus]|nr:hypothetical protein GCM10010282_45720 [Streptomyces roseolus]
MASAIRSGPSKVPAITGAREPSRGPDPMSPAASRRPSSVRTGAPFAYGCVVRGRFRDSSTVRGSGRPYRAAGPQRVPERRCRKGAEGPAVRDGAVAPVLRLTSGAKKE